DARSASQPRCSVNRGNSRTRAGPPQRLGPGSLPSLGGSAPKPPPLPPHRFAMLPAGTPAALSGVRSRHLGERSKDPRGMRVVCIGAGPAGLYFALLFKKAQPSAEITVVERNAPGVTFGWGVVFSDETLSYLEENDPPTHEAITKSFAHW